MISLGKPLASMLVTEGWGHARSSRMHQSLDLRAPVGTPTFAAAGGTVLFAGQYGDGSGGAVEIDHGSFATRYLHLSKVEVKKGQKVSRGQRLGQTGFAVSPHLHFDLWALPSEVSSYVARFGKPVGIGQTKSFGGKLMTKLPAEPLVPASYQKDVVEGALKHNVKLYKPVPAVLVLAALGVAGWLAYRYWTTPGSASGSIAPTTTA